MASANFSGWAGPPSSRPGKAPDLQTRDDPDAEVLDEPYCRAVLQMDYRPEDVLKAVKTLQRQRGSVITAKALLEVIMDADGKDRTPRPARGRVKRPADDRYGSDGESEDGSLEYQDALSSLPGKGGDGDDDDDLQEDGEAAQVPGVSKVVGGASSSSSPPSAGPPAKKPSLGERGGGEGEEGVGRDLRVKLLALREENRRLKSRQMCRKCRRNPVSITFLPCGHFSFCQDCGQRFDACPLCRKTILADVKTFLA